MILITFIIEAHRWSALEHAMANDDASSAYAARLQQHASMNMERLMTDMTADRTPESLADIPLQPTGSGVADLEIAYEQMKLAEDATTDDHADDKPVGGSVDNEEVEAHPS